MGNSKDDTHRYPTLCVTILGKKKDEKLPVLCLVLWKSRGQSCLHGAEVWLLCSGANKCPVVCVIAARLKGKKEKTTNKAKRQFMWKADLRGVSILLGEAILQQKGWSASVWGSPRALSSPEQATRTGGEPRADALLRKHHGELCECELLHCTVLCHKESGGASTDLCRQWTHSTPNLPSSVPWAVCPT